MKSVELKLLSIDEIKSVVRAATEVPFDIDLVSGKYIVDAKSIMGIFGLDFSNNIRVDIHADEKSAEIFCERIDSFIVK